MIESRYNSKAQVVLHAGDCMELLATLPDSAVQLVVTSPPYNIGKPYEKRIDLQDYLEQQAIVIAECVRVLSDTGSICWQVGNFVDQGEIIPLDIALYPVFHSFGLKLRNRIVWHFEHGLHCNKRFSGRYETVLWFTKSDQYFFNLDLVRVPQKYPGKKHFKGDKAGTLSGNPLGKNPSDLWIIPNVKSNHVEKTSHPCQYPVELVERLVLSMTQIGDLVLDPFLGAGTSIVAAIKHQRRGVGSELSDAYVEIAKNRIEAQMQGVLKTRPMHLPVFDPAKAGKSLTTNQWIVQKDQAIQRHAAINDLFAVNA